MMRRCWLVVALTVVVGACTSGDTDPASTTGGSSEVTAPNTGEVVGDATWTGIVVDSEGVTGLQPHVLVSNTGDVSVVYQREVAAGRYETRLAFCEDPTCAEVAVTSLTVASTHSLVAASLLPDRSPIITLSDPDTMVVVSCADPACSSTTETEIAGVSPLGLGVSPGGYPVVAYGSWVDGSQSYDLYFGVCGDVSCSTYHPVRVGIVDGFGRGSLQFLPDGSPVLFFEGGHIFSPRPYVAVCGDPGCTEATLTEIHPDPAATLEGGEVGLPQMAYVANDEVVRLVRCLDDRCSTTADLEVYRRFDGAEFRAAEALVGDQATPCIAAYTIPLFEQTSDQPYATGQVTWVVCGDTTCGTVSTHDVGESNLVSVAALPGGGVFVAAQTGRPNLCLPLDMSGGEECADPTATDLSTLTLYMCHGPACTSPTDIEPEPEVAVSGDSRVSAIVFSAEDDIFVLPSDSSEPANLTNSPESGEGAPVWSPDGTRIAFTSDRNATEADDFANYDIYIMDADGTNLTQVTDDPTGEFMPDWSPDGTRLVFARQSDTDDRYLVIVDLDSGHESQLTDQSRGADLPAWSPDGTKIVFSGRTSGDCSRQGIDCNTNIFVIDVDGSHLTQLTDRPGINALPDWSPDGSKIAFHTTDPSERRNWDIIVVSHDGAEVFALTDYGGIDAYPSWSPDGKTIAFTSDRSGTQLLYTMSSIDGSGVTLIAPGVQNATFPDWSPIGNP